MATPFSKNDAIMLVLMVSYTLENYDFTNNMYDQYINQMIKLFEPIILSLLKT